MGHFDPDYFLVSVVEARGGPSHEHLKTALGTGEFGFIEQRGDYQLWGRGFPTEDNRTGLRALRMRLPVKPKAPPPPKGDAPAPGADAPTPGADGAAPKKGE
jgi:hypothetical protein